MSKSVYTIKGTSTVAGKSPGDTISEKDLENAGANVHALLAGGILIEATKEKANKDQEV